MKTTIDYKAIAVLLEENEVAFKEQEIEAEEVILNLGTL
jgi:hypothetical protein